MQDTEGARSFQLRVTTRQWHRHTLLGQYDNVMMTLYRRDLIVRGIDDKHNDKDKDNDKDFMPLQ